ncbi:zinc-ribbon domain-containing protein [Paraflavitalea pollutisoli]|uniref:zinc-ribbon domain-containing protein n=1 Tax=Paraflavitalea pollutisoli TaxID=3034143 RepID=UPI0023ED6A6A|nr:zinc-ribbon domain-containing protein [Paraflavitalea sp. H1-2-19X]
MFIIYGQKKMRINRYSDHQQACSECRAFDMEIKVYHGYFHVFFIPFWPINDRTSTLQCKGCGRRTRIDSLQYQYEKKTKKSPFLYTGLILVACLIVWISIANHNTQLEKKAYVTAPQEGDIYTMQQRDGHKTEYYFLKVVMIKNDSIYTQHSNLLYTKYVSEPNDEDYFVEGDVRVIGKRQLLELLQEGEINGVKRP